MELDLLYSPHLTLQTPSDDHGVEDSGLRPDIYSTMQDYDPVVQMGSSIGVHQPANSGTVSAVIRLRDANGDETNCGLNKRWTCHVPYAFPVRLVQEPEAVWD
jgi:hypothetical protein